MRKLKDITPMAFSIIAIGISLFTLYVSHLRPAKIEMVAGEVIYITDLGGNIEFRVSLSFSNRGARVGTVRRVAAVIQPPEGTGGYLLEPIYFDKLDEEGKWMVESVSYPIPIHAGSTVTKHIRLVSSLERDDFHFTREGQYIVTLLGWTTDSLDPSIMNSFSIQISNKHLKQMEEQRQKDGTVPTIQLRTSQWSKFTAQPLDKDEIIALFRKAIN